MDILYKVIFGVLACQHPKTIYQHRKHYDKNNWKHLLLWHLRSPAFCGCLPGWAAPAAFYLLPQRVHAANLRTGRHGFPVCRQKHPGEHRGCCLFFVRWLSNPAPGCERRNGVITTQGDANPAPEKEKITRVDGKLLFAIPKVGYVIDVIRIFFNNLGQLIRGSG